MTQSPYTQSADLQSDLIWLPRSIFFDPRFAKEPYSHFGAYLWLVSQAAPEDMRISVNGTAFELKRGQYVTTERALAERWMWSKSKVRRFLADLAKNRLVTRQAACNATLITIIDYKGGTRW